MKQFIILFLPLIVAGCGGVILSAEEKAQLILSYYNSEFSDSRMTRVVCVADVDCESCENSLVDATYRFCYIDECDSGETIRATSRFEIDRGLGDSSKVIGANYTFFVDPCPDVE